MTAVPHGQPAGEGLDDVGLLCEVRDELARRGIVIEDPAEGTPVPCLGLLGAWCEIDLRVAGALALTYVPLERDLRPDQAVRLALALLGGGRLPGPATAMEPDPGLPLKEAAGRVLAACGMAVQPVDIDYGDGEVSAELMVTSPAGQGRLWISDRCEFRWEYCSACPGSPAPGLSPSGIAGAIAAALAGAAGEAR